MIFCDQDIEKLIKLFKEKNISLEGNICKVINANGHKDFKKYLDRAVEADNEKRAKRLTITKKIQQQNKELKKQESENIKLVEEAEEARQEAEDAKHIAETDLDILQKKSQYELIGSIVKVALFIIVSVGLVSTLMYVLAIFTDRETQIIGSTWSNMLGILLTNAFSIVGTITGVKYATDAKEKNISENEK
jgi:hypothetical protein